MLSLTPAFVLSLLTTAPLFAASQADPGQNATTAYTPTIGACPANFQLVRSAPNISTAEAAYVKSRRTDVLPGAWKSYVANVKSTNNVLPDYVEQVLTGSDAPTLGIAISGGGYRAALFGAGVLNSLDGRNNSAVSAGTGGLLQAATYLSGLSGGSWLVTSLAQADFPTINDLVIGDANRGWLTTFDILSPGGGAKVLTYIGSLITESLGKHAAGFAITIADIWSRALSRHFVSGTTADNFFNDTLHGAGVTFSSIAGLQSFTSHQQPFPIVVATLLSAKGNKSNVVSFDDPIPQTNPVFEFNVYEMGSFDPSLASFTPTQYLGTRNSSSCVTGFDQASFVMATSAELFNDYNTSASALANSSVGSVIQLLNRTVSQPGIELDAAYYPNPFFGVAPSTFLSSDQDQLTLVDGGEDGQVIPIQPLLVKSRAVDVIFAVDSNSDHESYANGRSLIASYKRAKFFPDTYAFPPIPETNATFISQNLATQPSFFGCSTDGPAPLVIYLANGRPPRDGSPGITNSSTSQLSYNTSDVNTFLDQSFAIATQGAVVGGENVDKEWPACLACAVSDRARARAGAQRSGICVDCFQRYCWNGTETAIATTSSGSGTKKKGAAIGLGASGLGIVGGLLVSLFVSHVMA